MLYGTIDNGAHWRCLGMVDTVAFLFDIGFPEASEELLEAPRTGWTRPAAETAGLAPGARRRRRRQIPAPWSKARSSASISWVWRTASWRLPLRSGWISSSSCSISTMRATRHLTASATGSGR